MTLYSKTPRVCTSTIGFLLFFSLMRVDVDAQVLPGYFNIMAFGAKANGTDYDTEAIQRTIEEASAGGGGVIYFPPGTYLTKTIILRDYITLHIERGATVLSSTELNSFDPAFGAFEDSGGRKFGTSLIFAKDASHIGIRGDGIIDGQGYEKYYPKEEGIYRPSIIRFIRCKSVRVEDVTLLNSAAWVQHYIECEDLNVEGITVRSYSNKNNDGLDIESCQRVFIRGCNIDSEDDSIVLKTLGRTPCRDVVISDCIISGLKSAIKTGTESIGNFENISISNCTVYGTRGISLLSVDGGNLNNITISNISMRDSYAVIVMRLGNRMRGYAVPQSERPTGPGVFQNIMIHNVQAMGVTESNDFICGIPGHPVENVTLSNIRIEYAGGGTRSDAQREIPELTDAYPKAEMFGTLPAYGFFIRHARNVNLRDMHLYFSKTEHRPAIFCDMVQDLSIDHLQAESEQQAAPLLMFRNTSRACIRHSQSMTPADVFLSVEGKSDQIELIHNDLRYVRDYIKKSPDLEKEKTIRVIE